MERVLLGVGILERDDTGDVIGAWAYPGVEETLEQVAITRSDLLSATTDRSSAEPSLLVSKFGEQWMYQCTRAADCKDLAKVTHFSVWVLSKDFHPELYVELARLFAVAYNKEGNPVNVLQAYLSVFARGAVGSFNVSGFDIQHSMLAGPLKESILLFGDTFILLWVAMLLKKRIAVYCDETPRLLQFLRCLPLLVWHRRNFDLLHPLVQLQSDQLEDLTSRGVYCAGFTDDSVKVRGDLYDVLVDLPGQSLSVSEKAKSDLGMGDFHRNLGSFLVSAAETESATVADLVKGLAKKTGQLFKKLAVLKEADQLNLEALEGQSGVSRSFARFLYNVAVSESMLNA